VSNTVTTTRLSAGFIAGLPFRNWRASGDVTVGEAVNRIVSNSFTPQDSFVDALASGTAGPGGEPALLPLGDWPTFVAAAPAYFARQTGDLRLINRFSDVSLRLGGPLRRMPGGDLTATLLLEARREDVPGVTDNSAASSAPFVLPERREAVQSAYAEFRAPLGRADAENIFLRGLELQLAVRFDRTTTTLPDNGTLGAPSNDRLVSLRRSATAVTVGARWTPVPAIMLRGSFATGELPPTISEFQESRRTVFNDPNVVAPDPKRGNELLGVTAPFVLLSDGSHDLQQAAAQTLTLGVVLNPSGPSGPRLSLDYSRTTVTREPEFFGLFVYQLLAAEDSYPGRVIRGTLTAADAAAGFTAGPVLQVDKRAANTGAAVVDAVDLQLGWLLDAGAAGRFRLHGAVTWEPNFTQKLGPGQPTFNRAGFSDGPLIWRGNAGVEWTFGANAIDVDAQYFDSYRVSNAAPTQFGFPTNAELIAFLGETHIPSQTYVDLAARRQLSVRGLGGRTIHMQVQLAIQNLLDRAPPITNDPLVQGFSPYGDPRRRRVVLTLSSHF
jgi:hypothetical protein